MNRPKNGKMLSCRANGCNKEFKTYAGRLIHEKKVHAMHMKMKMKDEKVLNGSEEKPEKNIEQDQIKQDQKDIENNKVITIPEDQDNGMIVIKKNQNGFPEIDREGTAQKFIKDVPENISGGPVWIMIRAVARILSIVGEQDYLEALEPVEKEIKSACSKLTGIYFASLSPMQQVFLYTLIAWIPSFLLDLPVFWKKIRKLWGKKESEKIE